VGSCFFYWALLGLLLPSTAQADGNDFWARFSDGRAELNGYVLTQPRYGQLRKGYAVLIYVTEPFSRSRRVKVDRYDPRNPDHFTALKLNHIRRFQTGIYDYAVMTSVFAQPLKGMRPIKVSFSSQEWCGHVYEEVHFEPSRARLRTNSYFEGETKAKSIDGALSSEDAIWITARGLMSGGPGKSTPISPMLGSATLRRLRHLEAVPASTQFKWSEPENRSVPAGKFVVRSLNWNRQDGRGCSVSIEVPPPHRVVEWRCSDGERAQLTGTRRLAYWTTARAGDEKLLKDLGLAPPVPTRP